MSSNIHRVLVTGDAGFIGSHIVDLATGDLGNLTENRDNLVLHQGDISNRDFVREAVKGYDAVIHEAALVSVARSVEDPFVTNSTNVTGTLNVLKAAVDARVSRFVYASSSSVYGETDVLPKREDLPARPLSPYAVSKLAAENYCVAFARVYDLRTICLRYFNVFGPRQRFGPYSGVIPIFIGRIGNGQPPKIYGDGEQTRDFTYVSDVVEANLLAMTADVKPVEVFNIAAGKTCTINQLAGVIAQIMGREDLEPVHLSERRGDVKNSYADISKAVRWLGYVPRTTLHDGLKKVVAWFESNPIQTRSSATT
jgi:UDP-glucose 4-epimerase